MATAVLFNGGDLLMMKRAETRLLSPGMWAAVGGHVEPAELQEPRNACLREIEEETGLAPWEVEGLTLRYVLLRLRQGEIRQQLVYIGNARRRDVIQTREGELHWIPPDRVFDRSIPYIYRALLEHYFANGPSGHPWVGTCGPADRDGQPTVVWAPFTDPEP